MRIAITGASGFVARHLVPKLRDDGHELRAVGRNEVDEAAFDGCDAIIHLAGENIAQRWTAAAKTKIRESRVDGTRRLVAALGKTSKKPEVLVAASAIGIYGDRGDELLTEASRPGSGFLADLTREWEEQTNAAEQFGIRVVTMRFGVILGRDGGAFPKMARPFKFGLGGRLGSGKQWLSWIHIEDVVSLIAFALERDGMRGPVNATAPNPVTNAKLTRTLASVLHGPR